MNQLPNSPLFKYHQARAVRQQFSCVCGGCAHEQDHDGSIARCRGCNNGQHGRIARTRENLAERSRVGYTGTGPRSSSGPTRSGQEVLVNSLELPGRARSSSLVLASYPDMVSALVTGTIGMFSDMCSATFIGYEQRHRSLRIFGSMCFSMLRFSRLICYSIWTAHNSIHWLEVCFFVLKGVLCERMADTLAY